MQIRITIFLLSLTGAIVQEGEMKFKSRSLTFIDAFSYMSDSTYEFEITADAGNNEFRLLVLVLAEEDNCKVIGKTCTYTLMNNKNICKLGQNMLLTLTMDAYPVVIPSNNIYNSNDRSDFSFNANTISDYYKNDPKLATNYGDYDLSSTIFEYLTYNTTLNETNGTVRIEKISTKIQGKIRKNAYVYFAMLNCYNSDYTLFMKYSLVNHDNEQLSVNEIPHKV